MGRALARLVKGAATSIQRAEAEGAKRLTDREEYLRFCQQAAEAKASGATFQQIANAQGCSVSTAHHRQAAWFDELAKLHNVEQMRQEMSYKFDWIFAQLAREHELVLSAPIEGFGTPEQPPERIPGLRLVDVETELPTDEASDEEQSRLSLAQRIYLVTAIMRRMTEVVRRQAQVLGLQVDQNVFNIGPGAGSSVLAMTKIEAPKDAADQERAAEHLRDLSRLMDSSEP